MLPLMAALITDAVSCQNLESAESAARATTPSAAAAHAPIEFAGCATVERGPRCTLSADRSLRFWLPETESLTVTVAPGRHLVSQRDPTPDGVLYRIVVPERTTQLTLDTQHASWSLAVREPEHVPALDQAKTLREQGHIAQAQRVLEQALPTLPEPQAGRALALLARLALTRGETDAAIDGLRVSLARASTAYRLSDVVQDATALSFLLSSQQRYAEARALLDQAAELTHEDPSSRALLPHYRGVIALATGDLRGALALTREAILRTQRLGLQEHELLAREQLASALATLGRHAEAVAAQRDVLRELTSANACTRADRQETVTWFALLAEPAPHSELAELAEQAARLAEAELTRCPSPWRHRNHAIDQALLALTQADPERARHALEHLPAVPEADPALDAWEHLARGRMLLAMAQARTALPEFQLALTLAQHAGLWENQHLAWLGRARAQLQLSNPAAALQSYRQAEALLDDALGFAPLSEGQAGFQHAREAGTRELVALSVALGHTREALDTARHARLRALHGLARDVHVAELAGGQRSAWEAAVVRYREQRRRVEEAQAASWRVPSDRLAQHQLQLASLRTAAHAELDAAHALLPHGAKLDVLPALGVTEHELVLAIFEEHAFIVTEHTLRSFAVPSDRAAFESSLSEALTDSLRDIQRVRVISDSELAAIDIHALPLLQQVQVVYALDLEPLPQQPSAAMPTHALIVADATGDLAQAELEAHAVSLQLAAAAPLTTIMTMTRGVATRAAVSEALAGADLFHFAGHAEVAGVEGIDSSLRLADGDLSLGDILQLPRVPENVVLSACDGARVSGVGFSAGLGLAQAFIAAGTRTVIAASRPVADALASQFFQLYYAALSTGSSAPAAWQHAMLQLRAADTEADWAAFRVITR